MDSEVDSLNETEKANRQTVCKKIQPPPHPLGAGDKYQPMSFRGKVWKREETKGKNARQKGWKRKENEKKVKRKTGKLNANRSRKRRLRRGGKISFREGGKIVLEPKYMYM
jgi:hypothetical protein